jgi:hypothetical protein
MKRLLIAVAVLTSAACAKAPEEGAKQAPAVSELGLAVGPAGLAELRNKVASRDDATCSDQLGAPLIGVEQCVVASGAEVYSFTQESHDAHPAAMFRGYAERNGAIQLEHRGWRAGDEAAAMQFYEDVKAAGQAPEMPEPKMPE